MKRKHWAHALTLFTIAAGTTALAHQPGLDDDAADDLAISPAAPPRVWRDVKTGQLVDGNLLAVRADGVVAIQRRHASPATMPAADLDAESRHLADHYREHARELNLANAPMFHQPLLLQLAATTRPVAAEPFSKFPDHVSTRWDEKFLYVESDGLPDHPMMIGIRAWQQQVPLPQNYTGDNAWRIPLHPVPAANPVSAKNDLFRGAIALAANGIPIFNPIKNDGRTDTFLAGELDEFAGHCGRADDYHYHIAPLHLGKTLGKDLPLAYALDGYPIYGLLSDQPCLLGCTAALDEFNGHARPDGSSYHYHATKKYPYINGGMHGEVKVAGGQIDPQPRAEPVREATTPLRGARIVGFETLAKRSWRLKYDVGNAHYGLAYRIEENNRAVFEWTNPDGSVTSRTYTLLRPLPATPAKQEKQTEPPADRRPPGAAANSPRRPWIVVHAPEMDQNKDGELTQRELDEEIDRTFAGYDVNADGAVTRDETSNNVRSPLAGFVKQHFDEISGKADSFKIDRLKQTVQRMFDKADTNHDHTLDKAELSPPTVNP